MVFLGDYINKGPQSAEVMEALLAHRRAGRATLLRGNHEAALLNALDTRDLTSFLKMGGAMTIRSYVGASVGPNVFEEFRACIPDEHVEVIRDMLETYQSDDVVAQHTAPDALTHKFRVSAHVPVGLVPLIGRRAAQLDTGCGSQDGRLTALLWPGLDYVQVDSNGVGLAA